MKEIQPAPEDVQVSASFGCFVVFLASELVLETANKALAFTHARSLAIQHKVRCFEIDRNGRPLLIE